MSKVITELSAEMIEQLQGQTIVLLNVVNKETGDIYSTALSWVYATDSGTIRFAIDAKSDFVRIVQEDPRVLLNFVSKETVYSVKGAASVKVARTEELTLKMALIEVQVQEIRDIIFYGGKIVAQPAFVKTYNADLIKKLDDEMKQALTSL
ncbi:pyridoxamine 5'-phosphate oxidase family protein [Paenibacillus sp. 32352]|uniref:pyridoxamine 5'-phosphate oxidase family protein n=1 Tax=Paenibacillus sp. 32352 TaxID=1969111 RepID=UPI0009AEAC40|nr:pyridoxamine 5'-phosphate oxidase family protein [Paenibacillus sp. 32352]